MCNCSGRLFIDFFDTVIVVELAEASEESAVAILGISTNFENIKTLTLCYIGFD